MLGLFGYDSVGLVERARFSWILSVSVGLAHERGGRKQKIKFQICWVWSWLWVFKHLGWMLTFLYEVENNVNEYDCIFF